METKGNGNYLPSVLTFKNCAVCPQCAFTYCLWTSERNERDRQCTYSLTLKRVRAAIVAVGNQ